METRDIRPQSAKKYIIEFENDVEPGPYDTITFFAGYNKNRKTAVVKIISAEIILMADDQGKNFEFEYQGRMYVEAIIEYHLSEILSHNFT